MAETSIVIGVRVRDMDRFRLFLYELETLRHDMRVGASPFAERIERVIDRFVDGGDDEGDGEVTVDLGTVETVIEEPCPNCGHVSKDGS